jgi:mannitol-1-phosphate/altronate dehydrogenase
MRRVCAASGIACFKTRRSGIVKTAVMYGAGGIGRGFLGQLLSESGYEVVFVDVVDAIVARLNADRAYPIRFVSNTGTRDVEVRNVRAVHGRDRDAVAEGAGGDGEHAAELAASQQAERRAGQDHSTSGSCMAATISRSSSR